MGLPPTRKLFGFLVTGDIEGGSGSGPLGIGKNAQDLIRFGFPGTGNREEEAGSGSKGIGNTVKIKS